MTSLSTAGDERGTDPPRISPELVLVDPDLSRRVRARLPLTFLRRRPPLPALHLAPTAETNESPPHPVI